MRTPPYFDSTSVVERMRAARMTQQEAALEELDLAVVWAALHQCAEDEQPAYWGDRDLDLERHGEVTLLVAGEGSPTVGEFAPAELGAALGVTFEAAQQLLGDALELTYRLPRLFAHVRAGVVPAWLARKVAALTTRLSWEAVTRADTFLATAPERLTLVGAEKVVHEVTVYFDPDRAVAEEESALEKRGVWSRRGAHPATADVTMVLDAEDAALFDQTLSRIAADLKSLGDTDTRDLRRAKAVGILADPQFALDLMSGREGAAPATGLATDLVVHLDPTDLTDGAGAAYVERVGAITTDLLATWLAHHDLSQVSFRVRPVLDLADDSSVDAHDPPGRMREQVLLLHATCIFPGCRRDSRTCDLDHIEPYLPLDHGGPPGQTRPENLAPLCRRHHRIKTHTAWTYKQVTPGTYTWTSPSGHQYDVRSTPRGRHPAAARR